MPDLVDRTDSKATYEKYYKSESSHLFAHDAPEIRQDLANHGLPNLDDPAYSYWLTGSKDPKTGVEDEEIAYKNVINARDGVLIAMYNFREVDSANVLPWSEIIYQAWQQSKSEDEKQGRVSGSLSTLKYSIQKTVVNQQTTRVLELAYENMGYPQTARGDTTWRRWTEQDTPNWFYALLGTDNCKGTLFLLTQHAVEAGKKEITEIWTRWDAEYPEI
ncbi:MAG: hypothetical protein Q9213_006538, partial [Squamulea squamosa]